jgi:hypothetical protein
MRWDPLDWWFAWIKELAIAASRTVNWNRSLPNAVRLVNVAGCGTGLITRQILFCKFNFWTAKQPSQITGTSDAIITAED